MQEIGQSSSHYRTLDAILKHTGHIEAVRKADLEFGDKVVVTTRNSTYTIHVLDAGFYSVSGGWFDQRCLSPLKVSINGCSWGGSVIMTEVMAACGLHLEFGNRVVTSRIIRFEVIRSRKDPIN